MDKILVKKKIEEKTKKEKITKQELKKSDILKQQSILDYFNNKPKKQKIFMNDKIKK
tara:strand:- start:561 stop:731 length:171 start_codon:yes stop_codon:yes gene_type:complete